MAKILNRNVRSSARSSVDVGRLRRSGGVLASFLLVAACGLVVPALADEPPTKRENQFIGVRKCKTCHRKQAIGDQYGIWAKSKHAKAFEALAGEKAAEWAAEAGVDDPQTDERCVRCHVTAYGVPESRRARTFDPELGVQCEACHGAGSGYRKKKIMMDRDLARSKGLISPPEEEGCRDCHNDESPGWKPDRYTREDGTKVGFDFEQAKQAIAHPVPEGYDPLAHGEAD